MKTIGRLGVAMILVIAACSEGTSPSNPVKKGINKLQLRASPQAVNRAGNDFYQVFVNADQAAGIGQYTIMTGNNHPVTISTGEPKNVLFGNGEPSTSYNTIFSYTTGTAYIAVADFSSRPGLVVLDPTTPGITATVTPLGSTGYRTTYTLAGPPQTPDKLTIVQDVNTHGTTFETSTVEVTTTITNNGSSPVAIGLRYLWDTQIGEDDGPTFQQLNPDAPVLLTEKSFTSPSFGFYRIQDNDGNETTPLFSVFGTVTQPTSVTPPPTPPDLLENASWTNSVAVPFAYTTNPSLDVSSEEGDQNDNAILYFWGPTQATAITLAAGASRTFSQSLVSGEANAPPPFNQDPTAHITAPANNSSFAQGASVSFAGDASDPEDGTLTGASLVWTSSRDGQIGTGTSFSTTSLSVGVHTITLTATDSQGATGTAVITVTITASGQNQSPTAHITAPANGAIITPNTAVTLTGTGSDPEDGALTGSSLVFTEGTTTLGTGGSVALTSLPVGPHTITLTATDSKGATGTATITVTVGYSQLIGTDGGSLCVEACHLSLFVPAGALTSPTTLIEWPVASPPSPPAGIVGSGHMIAPAVTFNTNAALGIGYDPATLPSGISESSLKLYTFVGGAWQPIANSSVNLTTHIVFGQVGSTGLFAIVGTP